MKHSISMSFLSLAFLFSSHAHAQFTQPPPTPPPLCYQEKTDGEANFAGELRCKAARGALPVQTFLDCAIYDGILRCDTSSIYFWNSQWNVFPVEGSTYYWAYIVNGQEYYPPPSASNLFILACPSGRSGYVRITAAWVTQILSYRCPSQQTPYD